MKAFYKLKCLIRFEAITSFTLFPMYLLWGLKYNATSWHMSQNHLGSRLERACQPYSLLNAIPQWTAYNPWQMCREVLLSNPGSPTQRFLEIRTEEQMLDEEGGFMTLIICDSMRIDWVLRPKVNGGELWCIVQMFSGTNSFAKWSDWIQS